MPETLTLPAVAAQDGSRPPGLGEPLGSPRARRRRPADAGPRRREPPARDQRPAQGARDRRRRPRRRRTASSPRPQRWPAIEAQYFLGLRQDTYLRKDKPRATGSSPRARSASSASPRRARPEQLAARRGSPRPARARPALLRGARGRSAPAAGVEDALAFARRRSASRSARPVSNWGPKIDDWIHAGGYKGPVPWCGCFVNACIMAGGLPSGAGWIGYTPAIVARAKAGTAGWSWHTSASPATWRCSTRPGGDPAVHVEIVRERLSDTRYATVRRQHQRRRRQPERRRHGRAPRRPLDGRGFRIIGFARPPYKQ